MLCTILVPDILMINAPIFKHSGGFGEDEFQSFKIMKEIYPTRNVAINNQNFTLSGIISHVDGTSLESGHFVADIISEDKMFHCDDDRVSRSEHLSGFGYVFTYSRTDHVDANENIQISGVNDKDDDIRCESCNEPFKMTSILRHVANSKCKHKVSAEFVNDMKEMAANRRKKKQAKHYQDNKDFYQDCFRNRHEEHKMEDILKSRERHQKHKMEDNLKCKERYQESKEIIHSSADVATRFKIFKEETMEGKIQFLHILIIT